jgi:xanthine dehydrogenase accessory factor
VTTEAAEHEVAHAPPGAFFLVMTHRHDLDQRIGEAILRRGDFGWFGLIGSRSKRERFARRWAERGIAPALIERVACPIGLPGAQGKEPGIIAVSVVAQMLGLGEALPGRA